MKNLPDVVIAQIKRAAELVKDERLACWPILDALLAAVVEIEDASLLRVVVEYGKTYAPPREGWHVYYASDDREAFRRRFKIEPIPRPLIDDRDAA
jgi:hypothetical protein